MVWGLIRDPRLQKAIDWLTKYMRFNDGVEDNPQVPPYDRMKYVRESIPVLWV